MAFALFAMAGYFIYRELQEENLVIVNETPNTMLVAMDDFAGFCVDGIVIAAGQTIVLRKEGDLLCDNAMLTFSGGEIRSVSCTWNDAQAGQPVRISEEGVSCPTTTPVPTFTRSP